MPIIVLTSREQPADMVRMLEAGADDYLTKPFLIEVLIARIRAVLRRSRSPDVSQVGAMTTGDLRFDLVKRRVTVGDREIKFTPTEYRLLCYLATHPGKVMSHSELLEHVWGVEYREDRAILRVFVGQLRRKIEPDPNHPRYITTVSYYGYRFEGEPEAPRAKAATGPVPSRP